MTPPLTVEPSVAALPLIAAPAKILFGTYIDWGQETCTSFQSAVGVPVRCWLDFLTIDSNYPSQWAKGHVDEASAASPGCSFVFTLEAMSGMENVTDNAIAQVADTIKYAVSKGVKPIIRLCHEQNGSWYTWGQKPELFVRHYNRIIGKLKTLAGGAEYMWAPNIYDGTPGEHSGAVWDYDWFYPGDANVDICGLDIYTGIPQDSNVVTAPASFENRIARFYRDFPQAHNKKFAIAETGAPYNEDKTGNEIAVKQAWFTQVYDEGLAQRFPRLCLVNWFEANKVEDGSKRDFRLNKAGVIIAFRSFITHSNLFNSSAATPSTTSFKRVAYAADWSFTDVSNMDMRTFGGYDVINWAFLWPDSDGNFVGSVDNPNIDALVRRTGELIPKPNVMIALGGWTGSDNFSAVVGNVVKREQLCRTIALYVSTKKLNGVDIDWEYPLYGGAGNRTSSQDVENLITFLKQLRGWLGPGYFISMAASCDVGHYGGRLGEIAAQLDWMNLMSYDFWGSWSPTTDFNASLLTQMLAVDTFLGAGCPASKLILGVPFYGRGCASTGLDPMRSSVGTARLSKIRPVTMMDTDTTTYRAMRRRGLIQNNPLLVAAGWERRFWEDEKVPTLFNYATGEFITYDDAVSVRVKRDYARKRGLGGVMVWELSQDYQHELSDVICGTS